MSAIWIIALIIGIAIIIFGLHKVTVSLITDGPAESERVKQNGVILLMVGSAAMFLAGLIYN